MIKKARDLRIQSNIWQVRAFFLLVLLIVIFAVTVFYLYSGGTQGPYSSRGNTSAWNEDWVFVGEQENRKVDLPEKVGVAPETPAVFQKTLPNEMDAKTTLCFRSYEQSVTVSVEGKEIYSYQGVSSGLVGKSTATAWNFVLLGQENSGKVITVTLTSPYAHFSGYFGEVLLGHEDNLFLSVTHGHLFEYVISFVLLVIALLMILFGFYLRRQGYAHDQMLFLGLFLLVAAVWLRVNTHVPAMFWLNYFQEDIISHLTLILLPITYILYYKSEVLPSFRNYYVTLFWFAVTLGFGQLILQVTAVADFYQTQIFSVILILLLLILGSVEMAFKIRSRTPHRYTIAVAGNIVLLCSIGAEMLCSLFYWYHGFIHEGTMVSLGLFIFTACILFGDISHWIIDSHRAVVLEREVAENRLYLLQGQMKPHFLYNTLQAIQELCYTEPAKAADAIVTFSAYLRMNIDSLNTKKPIPFQQELEHIKIFMDIEMLRFGEKLKFETDLAATDFSIPNLTLQPIIENAVHHGIRQRKEGGVVSLVTREEKGHISIIITDDGVGFEPEKVSLRALSNIILQLNSVGADLNIVSSPGKGTKVTIILERKEEE